MSYENFDPKDLLIQSFPTNPSGFIHRIPNGIRAVHLPTGIAVTCETDRSQHRNRHLALTELWEQVQGKPTYQELVAQVGILTSHIKSVAETYSNNTGHEPSLSVFHRALDEAQDAAQITPQQHLRQIQADAGRAGFIAGHWAGRNYDPGITPSDDEAADKYAARVKAGEV